jgi:uncharacterized phage protein (TIGR01671 family)
MEREILFRGKRADNGEWIERYYRFVPFQGCASKHFISHKMDVAYSVTPETVSQYTGLKDKNGRKIFEGDIILINHYDTPEIKEESKVTDYNVIHGDFGDFNTWTLQWAKDDDYEFEIIGNIHD